MDPMDGMDAMDGMKRSRGAGSRKRLELWVLAGLQATIVLAAVVAVVVLAVAVLMTDT